MTVSISNNTAALFRCAQCGRELFSKCVVDAVIDNSNHRAVNGAHFCRFCGVCRCCNVIVRTPELGPYLTAAGRFVSALCFQSFRGYQCGFRS